MLLPDAVLGADVTFTAIAIGLLLLVACLAGPLRLSLVAHPHRVAGRGPPPQ